VANPTELAMKHGLATAAAIVATVMTHSYLEALTAPGIALVFVLLLALFNGIAAFLGLKPGGKT